MTVKNNKRMFYCDYIIVGQVTDAVNPPDNIESYVFKEREVKIRRPKYNPTTGEFLDFVSHCRFIVCRGFIVNSFYKRKILNCFRGTMFKRHRLMFDFGDFEGDEFSHIYFCLPSVCDWNEEINK